MAKSIKVSEDEMDHLRKEAELSSRSIAGQVEHWLRIGRAIEHSSSFSYQRVRHALSGLQNPDHLSLEEQEVFYEDLSDKLTEESQEQKAFFENRRRLGLGVDLDETGKIVQQAPES